MNKKRIKISINNQDQPYEHYKDEFKERDFRMTTQLGFIIFFLILIFIVSLLANRKLKKASQIRIKQREITEEQQRLLGEILLKQT